MFALLDLQNAKDRKVYLNTTVLYLEGNEIAQLQKTISKWTLGKHLTDPYLISWPIVYHGHHLPTIFCTKVHSPRPSKQTTVVLANKPDGWCVNDRRILLNVIY